MSPGKTSRPFKSAHVKAMQTAYLDDTLEHVDHSGDGALQPSNAYRAFLVN